MYIEPLKNHSHRIDELSQLLHEEWKEFSPWMTPSLILERLKFSSSEQQFPFTYIALSRDNKLLGTASIKLRELPEETDKNYWLGEVLIRNEMRGQGIGSALIRSCINYTFNLVDESLYLYTPDQQALYKRFGWVDVGEKYINGEIVTIMELNPSHNPLPK
jgi:RimJ/RimL family protein N-acetyltransferase